MGHDNHVKKIGWTIVLNIIITIAEYVGGFFSGSLALMSDAGHNLSDVISLILGYFGERVSKRKPTKNNSFGLKRTEILTALINSLLLWMIAIAIIIEGINRLYSDEHISVWLMLGVAVIGLIGNLLSVLILNKSREHDLNMSVAYLHLLYDTLSSVAVIISGVVIYLTNFVLLDILISFLIALMIFYSGFKTLKKCIHILMQGVPEFIDFEDVFKRIEKSDGVKSAHDLHIWSIDSNDIVLSCHICLDKSIKNSDDIINSIDSMLKNEFGINHTTVQVEKNEICEDRMFCSK